ncbi:peroxide stress protein YaaA [Clostridium polynesiense]|uniref:peroxide stress protein YaaA n=1 Tax=Clostridium polynesiense TaxID=1325933 RepID=UPI00058EB704|nr:peroxide stress protein YaaA [Clostridium polynesiense]
MITIISPAKTLDFTEDQRVKESTEPIFKEEAALIAEELKKFSPEELEALMKISPKLAELNYNRYKAWNTEADRERKPAILTFKGDVYKALHAEDFTEKELKFSNEHLRILSGIYGVIRPFDRIQPYRLKMGTALKFKSYGNLYDFWKVKLTGAIGEELRDHKSKELINLASEEYSKAIDFKKLSQDIKVINIVFKELRQGRYKTVGILSKRARGYMSRYIIKNSIDEAEKLKYFNEEGYEFNEEMSDENRWIFTSK